MVGLRNREFFGPIWRRKFIVHSENVPLKWKLLQLLSSLTLSFAKYLSTKDLFMIQFIERLVYDIIYRNLTSILYRKIEIFNLLFLSRKNRQ